MYLYQNYLHIFVRGKFQILYLEILYWKYVA